MDRPQSAEKTTMKHSGIKMADLNPRYGAQVAQLLETRKDQLKQISSVMGLPARCNPTPVMIRQDTKGPNKTEAAFELYLRHYYPDADVKREGVTLKLGNGVRYTPDFFVHQKSGLIQIYETKGFMRDDAAVKIKVAASAFPFWNFFLVRAHDRRLAGWNVQAIMP